MPGGPFGRRSTSNAIEGAFNPDWRVTPGQDVDDAFSPGFRVQHEGKWSKMELEEP